MQRTNSPRRLLPSANCRPVTFSPRIRLALLLILSSVLAGCIGGARRKPDLERIFSEARKKEGKRPLIIIPGVLGSQLVNYETGEVVWPSAFRSSADGLSLPVSPKLESNRDNLVPRKIIDTARLAKLTPEVYVYHELLVALKKYGGYKEGDWTNPGADGDRDTFYVFPYDWRRDNVETARDLFEQLETLKRKLNRPDLRFNVLAHSMGGLVARYAARYGDEDLPPEGVAPRPTWAGAKHINKIIMFGTPNEGSADAFATLIEGYSVVEGRRFRYRIPLLKKLSAEDIFTAPAVFQLLPHNVSAHFLDENLKPVEIDLYDPDVWRKYNWSPVTDPDYRQRFVKGKALGDYAPFRGGSLEDLDAYFRVVLNRAKRFHEALDVVASDSPVPLLVFGGDCEETLYAPVLLYDKKKGRWLTLVRPQEYRTSAGVRVTRKQMIEAMYVPGDGRVTRRSLLGEDLAGTRPAGSIFNTALPIAYAVFGCDLHGELQNNPVLQDNALTTLVHEATR